MYSFNIPTKVHYGKDCMDSFGEILAGVSGKGILVASNFLVKNGYAKKLLDENSEKLVAVFNGILPNPTVANVTDCAAAILESKADFIVAIGGGSVLDCAKAAAGVAKSGGEIRDYLYKRETLTAAFPLIAIPTTAGTGSEVTVASVISDPENDYKGSIASDLLYPIIAVVDPILCRTAPKSAAVGAALDLLAHAVEGYMSKNNQPICDAFCLEATRLFFIYCEDAFMNDDINAKDELAIASLIAGLGFGTPKTGPSHSCSYYLTTKYGIPHGEACGLTLPFFMRMYKESDRLIAMAKLNGFSDVLEMVKRLLEISRNIGARLSLSEFNLTDKDIEVIISKSKHPNFYNSPVDISDEMLRDMYNKLR